MIHPARFIFSGTCVLLSLILTLFWGFPERSPRFSAPPASAKTDRSGVYDLAKARILTRVLGHVRTHYVDPKRVDVRRMAGAALRAVGLKRQRRLLTLDPKALSLRGGLVLNGVPIPNDPVAYLRRVYGGSDTFGSCRYVASEGCPVPSIAGPDSSRALSSCVTLH